MAILTFTADPIRNGESVIGRELAVLGTDPGSGHLLLDFTNVRYLNSTDLSALIGLRKRVEATGGRLTLFHVTAGVLDLFALTRLDTILDICREVPASPSDPGPGADASPEAAPTRPGVRPGND